MARRRKEAAAQEPTTYQALAVRLTVPPVIHIEVRPVYAKDRFGMHLGSRPFVEHAPYTGVQERGEIEGAYAVATFANRPPRIEYFVGSATENGACMAALNRLVPWLEAAGARSLPPGTSPAMLPSELHRRAAEEAQQEREVKTHPLFVEDADEPARPTEEESIYPTEEEIQAARSDTSWRDAGL